MTVPPLAPRRVLLRRGTDAEMGLRERVARIAGRLALAGVENPRGEAWLLLAAASGVERATLLAGAATTLSAEQNAALEALVRRREGREPIAYILGAKEFWSLRFEVDPAVLIPRPETETVVEAALEQIGERTAGLRILDLGTGSGCLLLALLAELPSATGIGVDHSSAALALAKRNAERLDLGARAGFRQGSWGEGLHERFDLIVSNPPYVAEVEWNLLQPEIRCFEPKAALVAGRDGLAVYHELAPECARLLGTDGALALEIGLGQADAVSAILAEHGLGVVEVRRDLAGIERCLVARRAAAGRHKP
jgi:release factor glutamine methyltransferase